MGRILRRLETGERWWAAEMLLRSLGLALLALCAIAALWLQRLVNASPAHAPTGIELLVALAAFLAWSLGWAFLAEGPGLFHLVDLPARHIRFPS